MHICILRPVNFTIIYPMLREIIITVYNKLGCVYILCILVYVAIYNPNGMLSEITIYIVIIIWLHVLAGCMLYMIPLATVSFSLHA